MDEREKPRKGMKYRYFKGTVFEIDNIALHTETGELMVIYHKQVSPESIWAKPYDMFMSEVDKSKYPDAEQRWKFEPIKGP